MGRKRVRLGAGVAAFAAWALLAGGALAADAGVTISGFAFSPGTVTVVAGDTVTWTNNDQVGHTATGDGFDTGTIGGGSTGALTFSEVGTYAYHCSIHPQMTGTIVVEAAAGGGGGGGGGGSGGGGGGATTPETDTVARAAGEQPAGVAPGILALLGLAAVLGALAPARRRASRPSSAER